ncbi:MAG: SpoIID/LytB domain-containing protein [Candidatus Neomarinimicrobiota bacterium]|nr:MAG: SpoIID/LytB domain-containing protein [Candidatus Neomarinimicrobiota bacterium]
MPSGHLWKRFTPIGARCWIAWSSANAWPSSWSKPGRPHISGIRSVNVWPTRSSIGWMIRRGNTSSTTACSGKTAWFCRICGRPRCSVPALMPGCATIRSLMLKRGDIPRTEPRIRVGLVLPEDHQTTLHITFSPPRSYQIRETGIPVSESLSLTVEENRIRWEGASSDRLTLRRLPSASVDTSLRLHPVRAGRGFHWEKHIPIEVTGDLILSVVEGGMLVVNELPLEDYLMSVATSEMGAECPTALLEAQTIVARSWLLAAAEQKHRRWDLDACNDDCCQRYQGRGHITPHSRRGVLNTYGQVLMVGDEICDARYSKSCGGMTERFENVWPGPAQSCFRALPDSATPPDPALRLSQEQDFQRWWTEAPPSFCSPSYIPEPDLPRYLGSVDEAGSYFRWTLTYSQEELCRLLRDQLGLNVDFVEELQPLKRGESGRLIRLAIRGVREGQPVRSVLESEYEIRRVLHRGFLYSSAFFVESTPEQPPSRFTLHGAGWGHGVGLCQIGALGMALAGYSSQDILRHYYPGTELSTLYTKDSS